MKTRRSCLFLLVGAFLILGPIGWYLGFVPLGSGTARAGLRHALDLKVLPSSVRINSSGSESWTDYKFEADFDIDPAQFDKIFEGRDFIQEELFPHDERTTRAVRIPDYSGFPIAAVWGWSHRPPDLREGDYGSGCAIWANASRTRAFLRYTAD